MKLEIKNWWTRSVLNVELISVTKKEIWNNASRWRRNTCFVSSDRATHFVKRCTVRKFRHQMLHGQKIQTPLSWYIWMFSSITSQMRTKFNMSNTFGHVSKTGYIPLTLDPSNGTRPIATRIFSSRSDVIMMPQYFRLTLCASYKQFMFK